MLCLRRSLCTQTGIRENHRFYNAPDFRHKKTAPNARFDTDDFLLTLACGRFGQAEVLSPHGYNVISGLAETTAANDGGFAHLDSAISRSHDLVTDGAFLLGFCIHFSHLTFERHFALVARKTERV
jgi:hypothetical protein